MTVIIPLTTLMNLSFTSSESYWRLSPQFNCRWEWQLRARHFRWWQSALLHKPLLSRTLFLKYLLPLFCYWWLPARCQTSHYQRNLGEKEGKKKCSQLQYNKNKLVPTSIHTSLETVHFPHVVTLHKTRTGHVTHNIEVRDNRRGSINIRGHFTAFERKINEGQNATDGSPTEWTLTV